MGKSKGVRMKTIGYTDRAYPNSIRLFSMTDDTYLLANKDSLPGRMTRENRIIEAFNELKGVAMINIYYVKGNKFRLISKRGF